MNAQLDFFPTMKGKEQDRIEELRKKISDLRCGLFKRYAECQKTLEWLEGELEDFIQEKMRQENISFK